MNHSQQNFHQQGLAYTSPDTAPPVRRRAHEGKSNELGPEVLMYPSQSQVMNKDPESTWVQKAISIPDRFMWMGVVIITIITLWKIYDLRPKSTATAQHAMENVAMAQAVDQNIHFSMLQTVIDYLQADRLETMLPLVRNPEQTGKRMERYYALRPFTPQKCLSLESVKPFFYHERQLWHVVAKIDQKTAVALMLEELPDGRFLVDWESHVDYQPMYWEQYILEQPNQTMSFRATAERSNFYSHEFSDESRWASYQLRQKDSEHMVHAYVPRNSALHKMMDQAVSEGPRRMILSLQTSKEFAARKAVVIKEIVSDSIYRIEPPSTLND